MMLKDIRKLEFEKRAAEEKKEEYPDSPLLTDPTVSGLQEAISPGGMYESQTFNYLSDVVDKIGRFFPLFNISLHKKYPVLGDQLPPDFSNRLALAFQRQLPQPHNYPWGFAKQLNDMWQGRVQALARDRYI